jgi:bifunctional DNA-binding transcriptional regulator/antitoxin component of YhaV-PrlF toxin-antitoxin module
VNIRKVAILPTKNQISRVFGRRLSFTKGISEPTSALVVMSIVVEQDEKGRILLPLEIRRKFRTKRFKIVPKKEKLELEPLPELSDLRGKYKQIIKREWEELEERSEEFVTKGKR